MIGRAFFLGVDDFVDEFETLIILEERYIIIQHQSLNLWKMLI
jgi:hypothetical protein